MAFIPTLPQRFQMHQIKTNTNISTRACCERGSSKKISIGLNSAMAGVLGIAGALLINVQNVDAIGLPSIPLPPIPSVSLPSIPLPDIGGGGGEAQVRDSGGLGALSDEEEGKADDMMSKLEAKRKARAARSMGN